MISHRSPSSHSVIMREWMCLHTCSTVCECVYVYACMREKYVCVCICLYEGEVWVCVYEHMCVSDVFIGK